MFRASIKSYFDYGEELSGNIDAMIDKMQRNEGGVFENQKLNDSLAKNPSTERYCRNIEEYISKKIKEQFSLLENVEDKKVYFENEIDPELRKLKSKEFGGISYTYPRSMSPSQIKEGVENLLSGRTIALHDIWAREIVIKSIDFDSHFGYKVTYKINLFDHFGLDLPDMEKLFNIVPGAKYIFMHWFILQHIYGYRPFITYATFEKSFEGNLQQTVQEIKQTKILDSEEVKEQQRQQQQNNININDVKW